jgi:hypothetical protein
MKYLVENRIIQSSGRIRAAIHSQNYFDARERKFSSWAIEDWENSLPDFLKLAYLPAIGQCVWGCQQEEKTKLLEKELKDM